MKNMVREAIKTAVLAALAMSAVLGSYRWLFHGYDEENARENAGMELPVQEPLGEVFSRIGSVGEEVRVLQERLREKGYLANGTDGVYDEETAQAVKRFQKDNGLKPDGIAGAKTLLLLGVEEKIDAAAFNRTGLLARIVWAQAGEYGYLVQLAAAKTILNRLESDFFADTLSACAFSGWAWDDERRQRFAEDPPATSLRAAGDAENGLSPVTDALFWYDSADCTDEFLLSREKLAVFGTVCFVK